MRFLGLAGLFCLFSSLAAAAEGQTTIPPKGDYRVVELVLEKFGDKDNRSAGGVSIGGDLVYRGGTRDGKLRIPSVLSVRDITGEVTFTADAVQGEFTYQAPRTFNPVRLTVSGTIKEGRISGTYRDKGGERRGSLSGSAIPEAELARSNAVAPGKDWPCWSGPSTSLAAAPSGLRLLEDFTRARLVWRSEEPIPNGNGNALNYHNLAVCDRTMGGGASAVVADGKVYVFYYQPAGTEFMRVVNREHLQGIAGDRYIAEVAREKNLPLSPFMTEKFLVKADDVVVCMDAATGKTLWKTVIPGQSLNQPSHKGGVVNNTPCVGEGRVFARAPGGTLYGLDGASGKLLWQVPGMSAEGVQPWSGARNQCTAPIHAGGTLIVPDNGTTLYGIDPGTGQQLWKLPDKSTRFQVPVRWVHEGAEYVLSMTEGKRVGKTEGPAGAVCLEPRTGKILWGVELPTSPNKGVSVFGDTMFVTSGGGTGPDKPNPKGACTAYRLSLEKAEKLWSVPVLHAAGDAPPAVNGKYVVVGGPSESHLYDSATGKDLAVYTGPGPYNEGYAAFVEDRVVLSLDGSHGHSNMVVLGATPETFKKLCDWNQPHPQTTSYHNKFMTSPMADGRIFMRGYDGVYCYDLRLPQRK